MVANAHQNIEPEAIKTFDLGYLVAVGGFLVFINCLPVFEFVLHGNPHVKLCLGEGSKQPLTSLMMIGILSRLGSADGLQIFIQKKTYYILLYFRHCYIV